MRKTELKSVCVCVPVRNEHRRLSVLLRALDRQSYNSFALCVLFDGCTDESEKVVRQNSAQLSFPVFMASCEARGEPNAGRARRRVMELGQTHLTDPKTGVLLTTDADSAPGPDWISNACIALEQADVATGRISRAGARNPTQDRLEAYYDRLHIYRRWLDPVPWEANSSHHFTAGANMGFRADAYAALGGFQARPSGEDALIVDEASRAGLRVRRDAQMVVRTSARRRGRVGEGLASHLSRLGIDGIDGVKVMHPHDAAWQYEGQSIARSAFDSCSLNALTSLAVRIHKPLESLQDAIAEAPNAEAFANRVVPSASWARTVGLAEAEAALDQLQQAKDLAA